MKTARWWEYINGGWVKLTLAPGATLRWYQAWNHDEGWSSEAGEWYYDPDDKVVRAAITNDGRDCDGRLTRCWTGFFYVEAPGWKPCYLGTENGRDAYSKTIFRPTWKTEQEGQRDYSAEAMGY